MTDLNELTEAEYHRHKSLSASGAKVLVRPGGPAKYRWMMDNPSTTKREFDLGHAVHTLVLGKGGSPVEVEGHRNATAVKDRIAEVRAAGDIPLKPDDFVTVTQMRDAMEAHSAGELFRHKDGIAEQIITWTDDDGTPWRSRLDWRIPGVVVDLKTAASAAPDRFERSAADFGYHLQAAVYREAARQVGAGSCRYILVVQETTPPYDIAVYEPIKSALDEGAALMHRAASLYRGCIASGKWPGYTQAVQPLSLPAYYKFEDSHV